LTVFNFGIIIPTFRKYSSPMKKYYLGEFEEIVLLATAILNKNAYGVSIKNEIETRLDRDVSMGAMHTALLRLEDKGYIRSSNGEATEERAGRPRKYYEITALGKKVIAYSKSSREKMWNAIPKIVLELKGGF
jgi:PadR family transcriptional regulator, regulatory protein PadR